MNPAKASGATRRSEVDGDVAEWSITDSVAHVQAVHLAGGSRTVFDKPLPLDEAFSRMPPHLWNEVRFRWSLVCASGVLRSNGARP